jgi:hypothetical protein
LQNEYGGIGPPVLAFAAVREVKGILWEDVSMAIFM